MKNYKLHVSEGFKDTYGNEMLVKKEIEARVLNVFESYGYELIKTPTLERSIAILQIPSVTQDYTKERTISSYRLVSNSLVQKDFGQILPPSL